MAHRNAYALENQILDIQELGIEALYQNRMQIGRLGAPDFISAITVGRSPVKAMVVVMVPAMVTPMMMTPVAEMTDAAWTVMGPDHGAAAVRVVIGIVVVIGVGRSVEEPPMKVMPVMESDAAAVEGHAPVKRAAWNRSAAGSNAAGMKRAATWSDAAAMESCATAMETATAAMTAATSTAVATTSASASASVTATYFDDWRAGACARDRRSTGIDQRHRLSVLT